jgi:GNAT superfamily N-acetyltransferase
MLRDQVATSIREAALRDSAAIAGLLGELGYPALADAIPARLEGLSRERLALALVADVSGHVVGLATAHAFSAIHVDHPAVYLTALVVAPSSRRQGIGRALVAQVEEWAKRHAALRVSVVTGLHRIDSHAFYEVLGYERTAHRYTKRLE